MDRREAPYFRVLGIPVSAIDLKRTCSLVRGWSRDGIGRYICVRDVHGVMLAKRDTLLAEIHEHASLVVPDGMPLVWLGKIRGYDIGRTAGADLFEAMMTHTQLRHYFYGGAEGVATELASVTGRKYPAAIITGVETPPYRALSAEELDVLSDRIRIASPDIVWIGLSTPRQEYLMAELSKRVPATLIGIGAVYDFATERVKRAPRWMQRSGLEWLHRLWSNPRRLWRRYLILAPQFVWAVILECIFGARGAL